MENLRLFTRAQQVTFRYHAGCVSLAKEELLLVSPWLFLFQLAYNDLRRLGSTFTLHLTSVQIEASATSGEFCTRVSLVNKLMLKQVNLYQFGDSINSFRDFP